MPESHLCHYFHFSTIGLVPLVICKHGVFGSFAFHPLGSSFLNAINCNKQIINLNSRCNRGTRKCNYIYFTEHCGCTVSSVLFALNLSYFLFYNKSSLNVYFLHSLKKVFAWYLSICAAKIISCPSKHRFDWLSWLKPTRKLYQVQPLLIV